MSGPPLYVLAAEQRALGDRLAADGLDEATIRDTLDGEAMAFDDKVCACVAVIREMEERADAIDRIAKAAAARAKAARERAAWMRRYVADAMVGSGRTRVEGDEMVVSVRENPGRVVIDDEGALPDLFRRERLVTEPDRETIGDALRAGHPVAGAHLDKSYRIDIR